MRMEIKEFNEKEFRRGEPVNFDDRIDYDEYLDGIRKGLETLGEMDAEYEAILKKYSSGA